MKKILMIDTTLSDEKLTPQNVMNPIMEQQIPLRHL